MVVSVISRISDAAGTRWRRSDARTTSMKPGIEEVRRRDVHRHRDTAARGTPDGALGERLIQHQAGQRSHQPCFLGERQELERRDQSEPFVRPAHQSLGGDRPRRCADPPVADSAGRAAHSRPQRATPRRARAGCRRRRSTACTPQTACCVSLARYIATSAQRIRPMLSPASAGATAMPMLALIRTLTPFRMNGCSSSAVRRRASPAA